MPKRRAKLKDLVARSITLKDAQGKPRIYIGPVDDKGHSSICLFGEKQRSIELADSPDGAVHIRLSDDTGKVVAGMGITSHGKVSLFLHDFRTGSRTELGSGPEPTDGSPQITLIHKGKTCWTTRKKARRNKIGIH